MNHSGEATTVETGIDSEMLARAGGDHELLAEVIALFLEDGPLLIEGIRLALAAGDSAAVRTAAHSLAGSASNFNGAEVTALARELEKFALAQDVAGSKKAFGPLLTAFLLLLDRLSVIRRAIKCAS